AVAPVEGMVAVATQGAAGVARHGGDSRTTPRPEASEKSRCPLVCWFLEREIAFGLPSERIVVSLFFSFPFLMPGASCIQCNHGSPPSTYPADDCRVLALATAVP